MYQSKITNSVNLRVEHNRQVRLHCGPENISVAGLPAQYLVVFAVCYFLFDVASKTQRELGFAKEYGAEAKFLFLVAICSPNFVPNLQCRAVKVQHDI